MRRKREKPFRCEDCGTNDENENLTRAYPEDHWRCFRCYGVHYPKSFAGRLMRGGDKNEQGS